MVACGQAPFVNPATFKQIAGLTTSSFVIACDELFAGSFGGGDDFVEALVAAQIIPTGIQEEIAAHISPMSRFLFCDQFLKPRIVADRIPDRIES
jgi:hypothetical protein